MSAINRLLDENVDWHAYDGVVTDSDGDIPIATHEGVWDSPFGRLRVYRLNNGQCIINAEDLEATEFWQLLMTATAEREGI